MGMAGVASGLGDWCGGGGGGRGLFKSEGDRTSCGSGEGGAGEVAGMSKSAKETVCGPLMGVGRALPWRCAGSGGLGFLDWESGVLTRPVNCS
jgi:hypothetical protein